MTAFFRFENEWQARALMPQLWRDPYAQFEKPPRQSGGPRLGDQREQEFRREVFARLDELQAAIRAVPAQTGLGHNNPPEDIESDDPLAAARQATADLAREIERTEPSVPDIAHSARILGAVGVAIQLAGDEPGKVVHVMLEKWREALVFGGTTWLATHGPLIQQAILNVLSALLTWLQVLFS